MEHYMKKICPERGCLIQVATPEVAAMYKLFRYGANAVRVRSGCGTDTDKLTI